MMCVSVNVCVHAQVCVCAHVLLYLHVFVCVCFHLATACTSVGHLLLITLTNLQSQLSNCRYSPDGESALLM